MLRQISVYAVLACGMTVVILTAGIDVSVSSVLGFSAVLFSILTIQKGFSPLLSIPLILLTGLGFGLLSGKKLGRLTGKGKSQGWTKRLGKIILFVNRNKTPEPRSLDEKKSIIPSH